MNEILWNNLETCSRSPTYTLVQNELLPCIKQYIQPYMVLKLNNQYFETFFGIMTDKVTDVSNMEQLRLVLGYVEGNKLNNDCLNIIEDCLTGCTCITGERRCNEILGILQNGNLSRKNSWDVHGN